MKHFSPDELRKRDDQILDALLNAVRAFTLRETEDWIDSALDSIDIAKLLITETHSERE